jgi:Head domain of trimeric autotransporter adhesin/Chaperone of endosialidase
MKHLFYRLALAGAAAFAVAAPASAQSDILLRLRSGSPEGDRMRVDSAGGLVSMGSLGIGIIPQTGAGERMMWYPFRAVFLAGGVNGTNWDDGNLGFYGAAFGYNTTLKGNYSFVTGYQSSVQQSYSVAMGYTANSNGVGAIAIGYRTTADGDYSLALGHRASTNGFDGAMVISDNSTTDSLEASANNQFSVRAAGGYRLYTNATETVGVSLNAGGSSWNVISDRNRKENFLGVDGEDILSRIRSLPVSTWQYIAEEDRTVRHIGPMAQDWNRAFGFSGDETTINMSDFDGVNLAAIQALEARTTEQAGEIQALRGQVAERDARIESLEARIARLEALLSARP